MALNFPNASRRFNERRGSVQFWGHDSSLEVSFFVDTKALKTLSPQREETEEKYLAVFDGALERIHAVARKKYSRNRKDAYFLSAEDF